MSEALVETTKMNIKYCLPIIKKSKEEVLEMIEKNLDYDFFEIWLGYLEDLDIDFVKKISELYSGKLIFLFRKLNLEKSDLDEELRQKIIKLLENSENLLDFDITGQSWGLNFIKDNGLNNKKIASFHNYKETPPLPQMVDIIEDMTKYNPSIYKFSTFCNTEMDAVKLLNLMMYLKDKRLKFIVLGMGEEGLVTRIFGSLWGNEMIFAPISLDQRSADGQLTKKEMEEVLKIINGRK